MNVILAFEPKDAGRLVSTEINMVLVNDSDYEISFWLGAVRNDGANTLICHDRIHAGEMLDIARMRCEQLASIDKISLQFLSCKPDKAFDSLEPVSVTRTVGGALVKTSNYTDSFYFDTPVFELPFVKDGEVAEDLLLDPDEIVSSISRSSHGAMSRKFDSGSPSGRKNKPRGPKGEDSANPNKVLPTIEVDLHIYELVDSTVGMTSGDMLELQLEEVRKTMKAHRRRIGQKIVFIHGKGDGVLRQEVHRLLRRQYPSAELHDANYQQYGGGATLVILHR